MTNVTPVEEPETPTAGSDTAEGSVLENSTAETAGSGLSREATVTQSQIEEEGEIAADYIEEFLDICDIDGDIDIETRPGRAFVSVNSDEQGNLSLLSKPETVNALQELTRLAVQTRNGQFSRLILDIGGSRDARERELSALVDRAILRVEGGAKDAALPPMTSYERKIVHDLVATRGYSSASEGMGPDRHTVISSGA